MVLGVAGIALSRGGGDGGRPTTRPPTLERPLARHAYAVNICGTLAAEHAAAESAARRPLPRRRADPHRTPFTVSALDRGNAATLVRFPRATEKLSGTELKVPGGEHKKNGDVCDKDPGKKPGDRQWETSAADELRTTRTRAT